MSRGGGGRRRERKWQYRVRKECARKRKMEVECDDSVKEEK